MIDSIDENIGNLIGFLVYMYAVYGLRALFDLSSHLSHNLI